MNLAKPSTGTENRAPKQGRGSNKKVAPRLVALSSAAVLTIYAAGYLRTRSAAERFAADDARRIAGSPGAGAVTLALAPPQSVDSSSRASVSASPAVPALASPGHDVSVSARPNAPLGPSPAPVAVAAAPVPTSTEVWTALPPTPPTAVPLANPATTDGDPRTAEPLAEPRALYKDGTYSGWGTSRHGDIQATVVVEGGRIASAAITQCLTRYSCSWISMLPPQVVSRQSPEVDYVSGATQSTNAFYYAVLEALSKAK